MLFVVDPMTLADVDQVMQIEHESFSAPWSARAYRFEIAENDHSTMLVVRPALRWSGSLAAAFQRLMGLQPGPVLGYAGAWLLVDEFHVSTIAVHPEWRRRGIGELLLLSLLEKGAELKLARATLEVRLSNLAAQTLYRRYGLEIVSRQKAYYADNNEDAYIMATPTLDSPVYQAHLSRCRAQLHARWQGGQQAREPAAGAPQTPQL